MLPLALDVIDQGSVDTAVGAAMERFGRIDVLVNNAGYGLVGAIEEATEAEFLPMFDTNVFGLLRVTKAVLPGMRAQRSGHIVNLSSIGGLIATPGVGYYNATKFAVEGLSEGTQGGVEAVGHTGNGGGAGAVSDGFFGDGQGCGLSGGYADYDGTAGNSRKYFDSNDGKQAGGSSEGGGGNDRSR